MKHRSSIAFFSFIVLALLGTGQWAQAAQKYLIFHQWGGVPVNDMVRYRGNIEGLPFNGTTVTIPASGTLMLGGRVSYDELRRGLAPMKGFSPTLTQNFVVIHTRRPPDVFDDWTTLIQSWRSMARAARSAGLVGIFFDNEEYQEKTWTYPQNIKYPGKGLAAYHSQMRLRGKQVMQAMTEEFPNIVVLTFHGPYISDPRTPNAVTLSQCAGRAEDLRGSFFVGMLEGAGPRVTIVDGGENYQYRSASDFEQSYRWRKYETPKAQIVPANLRGKWASRVNIAFAVFNKQWLAPFPMNPSIMRTTLANAIKRADTYVWFYEEGDWAKSGVPADWRSAIQAGVAAGKGSAAASPRTTARRSPAPKQPPTKRRTETPKDIPSQEWERVLKDTIRDKIGVDVDWLKDLGW